jgi:hypothetical protein
VHHVRRLVALGVAWSIVSGIHVARDVRNGWLLAHSDRDVRI